jgi:hypothetical protein
MQNDICGAETRDGDPCQMPAGWGTDHVGEGRCKRHGGNAGRPVEHGRYSAKKEKLQDRLEEYRTEENPGELWEELALLRALLQRQLAEGDIDTDTVLGLVKEIRQTLDTINKMMSRTALTAAEVEYLQAAVADVIKSYVPDRNRDEAIQRLRSALGDRRGD